MTANGYTVSLGDDKNVLKFIVLAVAQETDYSYCFWEGELDSWRTGVPIYIINIHIDMYYHTLYVFVGFCITYIISYSQTSK